MANEKKHIFIIGPSGVGKTTIGGKVAEKLGYKFVDLDLVISNKIGMSITDYFSEQGEAAFRIVETQSLRELCATEEPIVISTGAGTVLDASNITAMKSNGTVILLNAQVKDIINRVQNDDVNLRPLLVVDIEKNIRKQYESRIDIYNLAGDISIGTSNRDIDSVVDAVIRQYERFTGSNSDIGSQIVVGEHLINEIVNLAKSYSSTFIISQENIPFREELYKALKEQDITYVEIIVANGEQAKSFDSYESVLNKLAENKANRSKPHIYFR